MDQKSKSESSQIKSRKRVSDHGEVFTNPREVNAMLDLVKDETENIYSRFLEPACGDGNFLSEILRRKLSVCASKVKSGAYSQLDYEKDAVISVSSIYGIEILQDNVLQCRDRLLELFSTEYKKIYGSKVKPECIDSVKFLLSKNIIWGDALSYRLVSDPTQWIIISEWSPLAAGKINRRDYEFSYLVRENSNAMPGLFSDEPLKAYPPVYFLNLSDAYEKD